MKTKILLTLQIFFIAIHIFASNTKKTEAEQTKKEIVLKDNEYLIETNTKSTTFFVRDYKGLELSENCFKKEKPNCDAYTKSLKGTKESYSKSMATPEHNNYGAIHCKLIGGQDLLVKTKNGNDSDFCLFKDGSFVSSWASYYLTNRK